jgi:hypothetical protein
MLKSRVRQRDPKELAAWSREEYLKVCHLKVILHTDSGKLHAATFVCSKLMFNSSLIYPLSTWPFTDTMDVFQLKQELQLLTLGIGGVGVVSAYFSYTPEIAARYNLFLFLA